MHKKNKNHIPKVSGSFDLNVMPFIDIFSLLCTFLLFSAVFVSMGILEVQVPFLTNASPSKDQNKPKRSIDIKVEVTKETIELNTKWSMEPVDANKETFPRTDEGINDFHLKLVSYKQQDSDADKATLFVDDEIIYDDLIKILDAIKLMHIDDNSKNSKKMDESSEEQLFPKVVMGSVLL